VIDHGLDEEHVWAFRKTAYNQDAVFNQYSQNFSNATTMSHLPYWGKKLMTPAFFTQEKFKKMLRQWDQRLGLERIKMRHAITAS
jgi:hypothetical protein